MNPLLKIWADAAKQHEGWVLPGGRGYPNGSLSYRNNNPGNFRVTSYTRSLGATPGLGGFAHFETYDAGYAALIQFLEDAQANVLRPYRLYAQKLGRPGNMCTLRDFYHIYAPGSDGNDPDAYAKIIATALGVAVDTPINQI